MAQRAQPISSFLGISALVLTSALILAPPIALLVFADTSINFDNADWRAVRFTLLQATLSAILSCCLAIPVARALARRDFVGRQILLTILGAPFLLPVIVAILGLLMVWGRSGWMSSLVQFVGGEQLDIYGLTGVLLAHTFFNLPLVTRLILQGWSEIPAEHFRLAAQLSMRPHDVFRNLEIPMLRTVLPNAFLLVFMLCMTSFAVALTLGGGPKATTIELAIYEAVRFEFALGRAASLALVQFGLCLLIAILSLKITFSAGFGTGIATYVKRWDLIGRRALIVDAIVICSVAFFLISPLIALILRALAGFSKLPPIFSATITSLTIATISAAVSVALALIIALFVDRLKSAQHPFAHISELVGIVTLATSPFVVGTGLFIMVREFANPFSMALPVTALVNAMMALPIGLRVLLPAIEANRMGYHRLSESLDMQGWTKFRLVIWPAIKAPTGFAAGLSAALSMGDLGVITLFAPPDIQTLPLLMYRLMGSYQIDAAASVAVILLGLTLSMFWVFDRGGRYGRKA